MANTTLTQTGAQVQADLNKVEGLAEIKTIGSGLALSSSGELSSSWGGSQLYRHTFDIGDNKSIICINGSSSQFLQMYEFSYAMNRLGASSLGRERICLVAYLIDNANASYRIIGTSESGLSYNIYYYNGSNITSFTSTQGTLTDTVTTL